MRSVNGVAELASATFYNEIIELVASPLVINF